VLPMSIGEMRMISAIPPKGKIQCVAKCREASKNRGVADLVFHNQDGDRFAELNSVEVILRPNMPKA
jgi:phosphoheptose isomerase